MKVSINSTVWYDPRTVDWYLIKKKNQTQLINSTLKKKARFQTDTTQWENLPANSVIIDINLSQTSHHLKLIVSTIRFNFFIVISHLQIIAANQGRQAITSL